MSKVKATIAYCEKVCQYIVVALDSNQETLSR
jgi:hypothetical protein